MPLCAVELIESISPVGTAEARYAASATAAHRKAFGQFFTPPTLAKLMADWIGQNSPRTILDPTLGTGVLAKACLARSPNASVVAYEIDAQILEYAIFSDEDKIRIYKDDFLRTPLRDQYDGVIMNPPYIRHREIQGYDDVRGLLSAKSGYVIPQSANLYIYFTIKAALHLNAGGRAAILIPTEWMNANFAATFKRFLLETDILKEVVLFSGCSNIFEDALTTASILFFEKVK